MNDLKHQQTLTALPGGQDTDTKRWPLLTLAITSAVLLLNLALPTVQALDRLSFDYSAITQHYEFWRLLSGHIVHSSYEHLFWDLLAFSGCCYYLETRAPRLLLPGLIAGILSLNLYLLSPCATVENYSGLSGVLYSLLLIGSWHWAQSQNNLISAVPLLLLLGKTLLESIWGETVFVQQGWQLLSAAHLAGLMGGVLCLLWHQRVRNTKLTVTAGTVLLLSGCSIAAYTPVIVSDLSGAGDHDLSQQTAYTRYVGKAMRFDPDTDNQWFLKRFRNGRLTIEPATEHEQKERVCRLTNSDSLLIIKRIYYKENYHQEFFDAEIHCNGQTYLQVPLNIWSKQIASDLMPSNGKSSPEQAAF